MIEEVVEDTEQLSSATVTANAVLVAVTEVDCDNVGNVADRTNLLRRVDLFDVVFSFGPPQTICGYSSKMENPCSRSSWRSSRDRSMVPSNVAL
jgi:hypothetical protein